MTVENETFTLSQDIDNKYTEKCTCFEPDFQYINGLRLDACGRCGGRL